MSSPASRTAIPSDPATMNVCAMAQRSARSHRLLPAAGIATSYG
jgi:hypothetical protein